VSINKDDHREPVLQALQREASHCCMCSDRRVTERTHKAQPVVAPSSIGPLQERERPNHWNGSSGNLERFARESGHPKRFSRVICSVVRPFPWQSTQVLVIFLTSSSSWYSRRIIPARRRTCSLAGRHSAAAVSVSLLRLMVSNMDPQIPRGCRRTRKTEVRDPYMVY
jgi:hypothetical protein